MSQKLTRPWRRRWSMAVLVAMRDSQWAAFSASLSWSCRCKALDEHLLGEVLGVGQRSRHPVDEQKMRRMLSEIKRFCASSVSRTIGSTSRS